MGELDPAPLIIRLWQHGVRSLQLIAFWSRRCFANVYNLAGVIDAVSLQVAQQVPRH